MVANTAGSVTSSTATLTVIVPPFGAGETYAPKPTFSGSSLRVTVTSVAGRTYQLQRSDTLAAGSWINSGAPVTGTGTPIDLQEATASDVHRRFYRLQITQ